MCSIFPGLSGVLVRCYASAAYAVMRCPSVCPSVTRRYSVDTAKHIIKLFHRRVATPLWFFQRLWQYLDGNPTPPLPPNGGIENWGIKKSRFSTNISFYLGNDRKQGHSYYGMPPGTRTRSIPTGVKHDLIICSA